jgi:hypothetical protein
VEVLLEQQEPFLAVAVRVVTEQAQCLFPQELRTQLQLVVVHLLEH